MVSVLVGGSSPRDNGAVGRAHGQYCPLALAAELLCERWTLLIVSRLLDGCSQFNEIHRGVPRITATMLTQRLRHLQRAGVVMSRPAPRGAPRNYELTAAGRELEPLIEGLAVWGQNWARDMRSDDLDPAFLVWSMHMRLDSASMPAGRTVLAFEFSGAPREPRRFWLVNENGTVDMCLKDPGYAVDVYVRADLRLFIEAWRGFRNLRAEIASERVKLIGPAALTRQFPQWLRLSALASFPRKRMGREKRLACAARQSNDERSSG
jgi:DNA-binding HxlR family transcriptional regulator